MSKPFPRTSRRRIRTLAQLSQAAQEQRSVAIPSAHCFASPRPAAWVISMQARIVHSLIERGMYLYVSKKKTKLWKSNEDQNPNAS